jgi:hypothetical protein
LRWLCPFRDGQAAEQQVLEQQRIQELIGHIEYWLTRKSDAAEHIPPGLTLISYIRYRIGVEHPNNSHVQPEQGYTDEFIEYALAESKYVFGR